MTNKEKIKNDFGIELEIRCQCTSDNVEEDCITNGECLFCEIWQNQEFTLQSNKIKLS